MAEFDFCRPRRAHNSKLQSRSQTSTTSCKTQKKPSPKRPHPLLASITHLATPLIPLISVVTGMPHPEFPTSLLQYHLLTHSQLDSLARWYHQTTDAGPERAMYPAIIRKAWTTRSISDDQGEDQVELEIKRRRFGRFIGLRGCESPVVPSPPSLPGVALSQSTSSTGNKDADGDVEMTNSHSRGKPQTESLEEKMEREWRAAMERAEEERIMAEKSWRGRF